MSDVWTRVNGPGKITYDDTLVDYDDSNLTFDGGDGDDWVPISKPLT